MGVPFLDRVHFIFSQVDSRKNKAKGIYPQNEETSNAQISDAHI